MHYNNAIAKGEKLNYEGRENVLLRLRGELHYYYYNAIAKKIRGRN